MSIQGVLRKMHHHVAFWCPGCKETHVVPMKEAGLKHSWTFNGNYEKPTFTPSMIIRSGHYADGWKAGDNCWCAWNKQHPEDDFPFICGICHWVITDGVIQFQGDCTHPLAGQAVPLEVPPEHG